MALLVSWRGSLQELPEFKKHTRNAFEGELVVGRLLTDWSGERVGYLLQRRRTAKRVAIQNAELLQAGDVLQMEGMVFRPSLVRNPDEFSIITLWKRNGIEAGIDLFDYEITGTSTRTIALGYAGAYRFFGQIAKSDRLMPQRLLSNRQHGWLSLRGKVASLMASSLAAWVGSLPWMITCFGLVTPIAILASVVLIPATFLILAFGFFSIITGTVSHGVGSFINQGNSLVARGTYASARGFAEIPMGHYQLEGRVPADWVVFDPSDGGGASLISIGDGVMIDLGSERKYRQIVRPASRRWGVEPKCLFLTHPDGKHTGAVNLFEEDFGSHQVFLPVIWSRSPTYREYVGRGDLKKRGIKLARPRHSYHLGAEVTVEVLKEGGETLDIVGDSRGVALKVIWKNWKVLVMGDLGVEEERMLVTSGADLSADILIIGQHSQTYSGSSEFLEATEAKVVIKSSASFPNHELPSKEWLVLCEESELEVFDQGETGAVLMNFEDDRIEIQSFLQSERIFEIWR